MGTSHLVEYLEQLANYTMYRFGCMTVPTDLNLLATRLGIKEIRYEEMAQEGCLQREGDSFNVRLKKSSPLVRQRFSLAHEIGHLLLHKLEKRPETEHYLRFRSYSRVAHSLDEEAMADYLAGFLLLPTSHLINRVGRELSMSRISCIAAESKTSLSATLLRTMQVVTEPSVVLMVRSVGAEPFGLKWFRTSRAATRDEVECDLAEPGFVQQLAGGASAEYFGKCYCWMDCQIIRRNFQHVRTIFILSKLRSADVGF